MTTEFEVVEYVRDVNVLLKLDTYEDMTDAEIQSVIDFKVEEAKAEARNEMRLETQFMEERQLAAARTAHAQAAADALQCMLEVEIPWVTIGSDS